MATFEITNLTPFVLNLRDFYIDIEPGQTIPVHNRYVTALEEMEDTLEKLNAGEIEIEVLPTTAETGMQTLSGLKAGVLTAPIQTGGGGAALAEFVVSPDTDYPTIQSAIDAAALTNPTEAEPAVILVTPGVYTEDVQLVENIKLIAIGSSPPNLGRLGASTGAEGIYSVTVLGTKPIQYGNPLSVPGGKASKSGRIYISGFHFKHPTGSHVNSNTFQPYDDSNLDLIIENCFFDNVGVFLRNSRAGVAATAYCRMVNYLYKNHTGGDAIIPSTEWTWDCNQTSFIVGLTDYIFISNGLSGSIYFDATCYLEGAIYTEAALLYLNCWQKTGNLYLVEHGRPAGKVVLGRSYYGDTPYANPTIRYSGGGMGAELEMYGRGNLVPEWDFAIIKTDQPSYGEMYEVNETGGTPIVCTNADQYYPWVSATANVPGEAGIDFTNGTPDELYCGPAALGEYEVFLECDFTAGVNSVYTVMVFKNGNPTNIFTKRAIGSTSAVGSAGKSGQLTLDTLWDGVTLQVKSSVAGKTFTPYNLRLRLVRLQSA